MPSLYVCMDNVGMDNVGMDNVGMPVHCSEFLFGMLAGVLDCMSNMQPVNNVETLCFHMNAIDKIHRGYYCMYEFDKFVSRREGAWFLCPKCFIATYKDAVL